MTQPLRERSFEKYHLNSNSKLKKVMQRYKVHFKFPDCSVLETVLVSFPEFGASNSFRVGWAVSRPWKGNSTLYSEVYSVCSLFLIDSCSLYPEASEEFGVGGAVLRPGGGGQDRTLLQITFCLIYNPLTKPCFLSFEFLNNYRPGGDPAAKVEGSRTPL